MTSVKVIGGGPAGWYVGKLMKLEDPAATLTIVERNKADDTFEWCGVLSDEALDNLQHNDLVSTASIRRQFAFIIASNTLSTGA